MVEGHDQARNSKKQIDGGGLFSGVLVGYDQRRYPMTAPAVNCNRMFRQGCFDTGARLGPHNGAVLMGKQPEYTSYFVPITLLLLQHKRTYRIPKPPSSYSDYLQYVGIDTQFDPINQFTKSNLRYEPNMVGS